MIQIWLLLSFSLITLCTGYPRTGAHGREDRTGYIKQQYDTNKDDIGFEESKDDIGIDESQDDIGLADNNDVFTQSSISIGNDYVNEDLDTYGDYSQIPGVISDASNLTPDYEESGKSWAELQGQIENTPTTAFSNPELYETPGEENYDVLNGFPVQASPVKGEPKETSVVENDSAELADLTFDPTDTKDDDKENRENRKNPIKEKRSFKKKQIEKADTKKKPTVLSKTETKNALTTKDKDYSEEILEVDETTDKSETDSLDEASLNDETLQRILKDPDVIALIKENPESLEDIGDLENFLEESGILDEKLKEDESSKEVTKFKSKTKDKTEYDLDNASDELKVEEVDQELFDIEEKDGDLSNYKNKDVSEYKIKEKVKFNDNDKDKAEVDYSEKEKGEVDYKETKKADFDFKETEKAGVDYKDKDKVEVDYKENDKVEVDYKEKDKVEVDYKEKEKVEVDYKEKEKAGVKTGPLKKEKVKDNSKYAKESTYKADDEIVSTYKDKDQDDLSYTDKDSNASSSKGKDSDSTNYRETNEDATIYKDKDLDDSSYKETNEDTTTYKDKDLEASSYKEKTEDVTTYKDNGDVASNYKDMDDYASSKNDNNDYSDIYRSKKKKYSKTNDKDTDQADKDVSNYDDKGLSNGKVKYEDLSSYKGEASKMENDDYVKEFKDRVKNRVYEILEEQETDSKEVNKFEPFGKESLYKKYAERKVARKIDEVLKKEKNDLDLEDKYVKDKELSSETPNLYSENSDSIEEPYIEKSILGESNNEYSNKTDEEDLKYLRDSNEEFIDEAEKGISSTEINDDELGLTSEELDQLKNEESVKDQSEDNGYGSGEGYSINESMEMKNDLFSVVKNYKDFSEMKFEAVHKACVARTDQDGIPKEDDTTFTKLYGLESDMYMSLRKYINGENKQGRKLRSTDMVSMEVRPNLNGTVTRTLCLPIDRFNHKIPPEMENHLKVIALVLPNDPNIKLKEFQEVTKFSRSFKGIKNDYHFRYHANSLVNAIVDADMYESVDLHRYMIEFNTKSDQQLYMVGFISNTDNKDNKKD